MSRRQFEDGDFFRGLLVAMPIALVAWLLIAGAAAAVYWVLFR